MTLREWIADWLTNGHYSQYKWEAQQMEYFAREMDNAKDRLDRIAAMETPRCANIGKRMARVARGERCPKTSPVTIVKGNTIARGNGLISRIQHAPFLTVNERRGLFGMDAARGED